MFRLAPILLLTLAVLFAQVPHMAAHAVSIGAATGVLMTVIALVLQLLPNQRGGAPSHGPGFGR